MKKRSLLLASTLLFFTAGESIAAKQDMTAGARRLDNLGALMQSRGIDNALSLLTHSSIDSTVDGKGTDDRRHIADIVSSNDPDAFIACAKDGKIVFDSQNSSNVGNDATTSKAPVSQMITQLRTSKDGKAVVITETAIPGAVDAKGKPVMNRVAYLAYSRKKLLGERANDPDNKTKMICYTKIDIPG